MKQHHRRSGGWRQKQARSNGLAREARLTPVSMTIRVPFEDAWTSSPEVYTPPLAEFKSHVERWKRATIHASSLSKMTTHPSYRRLMGMGRDILPFLLRELSERPDHWLVALNAITGEDPAPAGSTFTKAVDAWLAWGRRKGYLE